MKRADLVTSIVLLLFALLVGVESLRLPFGTMRLPGIAFLPFVLAVLLFVLSLTLLITSVRKGSSGPSPSLGQWKKVAVSLGALFVFALVFEWLGYILSTVLLLAFLMRVVEPIQWWRVATVAVSSSLITYIVFYLLGTPFPKGLIGI